MRARRALLYMPGDDLHKIQKAITLGVDSICMDMEDGVALNRKADARSTILSALNNLDFATSERLARINAVGSGFEYLDLWEVLPGKPEGIVIPKVESPDQVRWASQEIATAEQKFGWPVGSICLILIVETARGIINLSDIAGADPRVQALIFGAEDLAGDIGAQRTKEGWEIFCARSAVVTHAAAYGLEAIDLVNVDFHDLESLREEALQGARMGYTGKQVIHPKPIMLNKQKDEVFVECVMQYNDSYNDQILCFAKSIPNPDGGTHLTGFRSALTRAINQYAKQNTLLKEKDPTISGDDVREGLVCVLSVKMHKDNRKGAWKGQAVPYNQ